MTPPLPPPNGMFTTAHFHVIQVASALTSSSVTCGMEADSALGRTARRAVLHAIGFETADVAVVHAHRHGYGQHALGILDHLPCIVVESQRVRCSVEILQRDVVGVFCSFVASIVFLPWPHRLPRGCNRILRSINLTQLGGQFLLVLHP